MRVILCTQLSEYSYGFKDKCNKNSFGTAAYLCQYARNSTDRVIRQPRY
jgi:hypothetical protein